MNFRAHPLDDAVLFFDPRAGVNVRVETARTQGFERRAPRVVMFGYSNACNLRCAFCSRDASVRRTWTRETAASLLRDLARAGVLEVAFGGGEPFLAPDFLPLVRELRDSTDLALHVTTNGTRLAALEAGVFGQVRLSIYDEVDWRSAARSLTRVGQLWGANVLVEPSNLASLPTRLAELASLGAHDVSLLAYVGPDAARHLDARGDAFLSAVVRACPLRVRVSTCFGTRLDVPQVTLADDCGAGVDFVAIRADGHLAGCSFQDDAHRVQTAGDVLDAWRRRLHVRSARRRGCTRARSSSRWPPIAMWRGFSGNNSGECAMVARFDDVASAEAYLAALVPDFRPGEPYPAPWRELFERERVASEGMDQSYAPDELLRMDRVVVARTDFALEDDFPELRALAWKRGADVVPGGIHMHDHSVLLFAVRARDPEARLLHVEAVLGKVPHSFARRHGSHVLGAIPVKSEAAGAHAIALEAAGGEAFVADLVLGGFSASDLDDELKRLGAPKPVTPKLAIRFAREDRAKAFEKRLAGAAYVRNGDAIVVDAARPKRLAVLALRENASVSKLLSPEVTVHVHAWRPEGDVGRAPLDVAAFRRALESELRAAHRDTRFSLTVRSGDHRRGISASVTTSKPLETFAVLSAVTGRLDGATVRSGVVDAAQLGFALRRVCLI